MTIATLIFAAGIITLLLAAIIYESVIEAKDMPDDYDDAFQDTEYKK